MGLFILCKIFIDNFRSPLYYIFKHKKEMETVIMDTTKKLTPIELFPTRADPASRLMASKKASTHATAREQIEGLKRGWSPRGVDSALSLLMKALGVTNEQELDRLTDGRQIDFDEIWTSTCSAFSVTSENQTPTATSSA
ncbi:MAG: hypothetical protein CMI53_00955 [Parcubacteria group bacterium]|nr:hypothetical protein [Parcubacteria group bacterium]